MRYYILKNGQYFEVTKDNQHVKDINNELFFEGVDLNNEDISFINVDYKKIKGITDRLITIRFNSLDFRRQKLFLIILFLLTLFFGFQYSNYYGQTKNLTLQIEQISKEKIAILTNNNQVNPVDQENKIIEIPGMQKKQIEEEKINDDLVTAKSNEKIMVSKEDDLTTELEKLTLDNKKYELECKNNIQLLTDQLTFCQNNKQEITCKNEYDLYREIENKFTAEKKEELKNIVKYEFLDEARALALKACNK